MMFNRLSEGVNKFLHNILPLIPFAKYSNMPVNSTVRDLKKLALISPRKTIKKFFKVLDLKSLIGKSFSKLSASVTRLVVLETAIAIDKFADECYYSNYTGFRV